MLTLNLRKTIDIDTVTQIVTKAMNTKEGLAYLAEQDREHVKKRQQQVNAIAKIERETAATMPALRAEEQKAEARYHKASAELKAYEQAFVTARNASYATAHSAQVMIRQCEFALEQSADPRIIALSSEISATINTDRHNIRSQTQEEPFRRMDMTSGHEVTATTAPHVKAYFELLQRLREEVRNWRHLALTQEELDHRIADVRTQIHEARRRTDQFQPVAA